MLAVETLAFEEDSMVRINRRINTFTHVKHLSTWFSSVNVSSKM